MKLLILGATGGTGRHLVAQALDAGYVVTALVRDAARLDVRAGLRVVVGDVMDLAVLRGVVAGQDAVLCALGTPPSTKAKIRAMATEGLVTAMAAEGVQRLVCLSVLGVHESWKGMPWYLRWIVVPFFLRRAYADHAVQEDHVRSSALEWILVRPPFLTDGPVTGAYVTGHATGDPAATLKISRADVAHFMLAQVARPTYLRAAAAIGNPRRVPAAVKTAGC